MKAKDHPAETPRGRRDPRTCKVQTSGRLAFILTLPGVYDRQPMLWVDRPHKFPAHIRLYLRAGAVVEDIKWKQLNGRAWWRIPEWPDGRAALSLTALDTRWPDGRGRSRLPH